MLLAMIPGLISASGGDSRPADALLVDAAGVLDEAQARILRNQLSRLGEDRQLKMVIQTLPSLEGRPIREVAERNFAALRLTEESRGRAILMLVAPREGLARMRVGDGLEGALPEAAIEEVLDQELLPRMRRDQLLDGLLAAIERIEKRASHGTSGDTLPFFTFFWFCAFFTLFVRWMQKDDPRIREWARASWTPDRIWLPVERKFRRRALPRALVVGAVIGFAILFQPLTTLRDPSAVWSWDWQWSFILVGFFFGWLALMVGVVVTSLSVQDLETRAKSSLLRGASFAGASSTDPETGIEAEAGKPRAG